MPFPAIHQLNLRYIQGMYLLILLWVIYKRREVARGFSILPKNEENKCKFRNTHKMVVSLPFYSNSRHWIQFTKPKASQRIQIFFRPKPVKFHKNSRKPNFNFIKIQYQFVSLRCITWFQISLRFSKMGKFSHMSFWSSMKWCAQWNCLFALTTSFYARTPLFGSAKLF